MRDTERREELLAAEIAADWLQKLKNDGPEIHAVFGRWLRESPRNVREMLLATGYQHALQHMKAHRRVDVRSLKEQWHLEGRLSLPEWSATGETHSTARSHQGPGQPAAWPSWSRLINWRLAASALLLVLASVAAITIRAISDRTLSTGPGEWQVARLVDGTTLHLGPRTQVSVSIDERQRSLNLERGEIMAYVAEDASRPFLVHTSFVTARAVGTAFAAQQLDARRVSITVREGLVAVRRTTSPQTLPARAGSPNVGIVLKAGEKVEVSADDTPLRVRAINVDRELAWVERRLILDRTVEEAIREMNRRNRAQIRLLDPAIGQRRIIGVFNAADPASFVGALSKALPVSVVEDGRDTLLLVPRTDRGSGSSRQPAAH